MRKIFALLLGVSLITLTGCFDIIEEVFVSRDGSGKYLVTMDMSSMFTDPFMKGMMEEAMAEQSGGESLEMEKDTTIFFKEMAKDADLTASEKQLIEKALMKMTMSEESGQMLVTMEFPFKDVKDLEKIMEIAQKTGANDQMSGGMMGGGGMMPNTSALFEFSKKKLSRLPMPKMEQSTAEEDENMEMMKMFLGTASYKTIYHLPGKVRKTDIPNATIDGNMVIVESSLLDMMENKAKTDGTIRFR